MRKVIEAYTSDFVLSSNFLVSEATTTGHNLIRESMSHSNRLHLMIMPCISAAAERWLIPQTLEIKARCLANSNRDLC